MGYASAGGWEKELDETNDDKDLNVALLVGLHAAAIAPVVLSLLLVVVSTVVLFIRTHWLRSHGKLQAMLEEEKVAKRERREEKVQKKRKRKKASPPKKGPARAEVCTEYGAKGMGKDPGGAKR